MSLCIAGAGVIVHLAVNAFQLGWTHTVEKTAWHEEWRIEGNRLVLRQARIKGSGAGMEPPPDAILRDGFYSWQPDVAPVAEITLRRAPQAGDWDLCAAGRCDSLRGWLGTDADPVTISACDS